MTALTTYFNSLTPTEKTLIAVFGGVTLLVLGGGIAVAIGGAESLVLVAGPAALATGRAANILARRL